MRNLTRSNCPSCAASINGVEQPVSILAPAFTKSSAHSRKPPQQASVSAVSCVSSVLAFTLAPVKYDKCSIHVLKLLKSVRFIVLMHRVLLRHIKCFTIQLRIHNQATVRLVIVSYQLTPNELFIRTNVIPSPVT